MRVAVRESPGCGPGTYRPPGSGWRFQTVLAKVEWTMGSVGDAIIIYCWLPSGNLT